MKTTNKLPVLYYTTSEGWQVLGHAKTEKQARKIALSTMGDHSLSLIKLHGFGLFVGLRDDFLIELNGGPQGWIYSVGKILPKH